MALNEDPVFDFSLKRWPPIYRYRRKDSQDEIKAKLLDADQTPAPSPVNLVTPLSNSIEPLEQTTRYPSPSELSSVPLMNPYPITYPPPLPDLLPPLPPSPPTQQVFSSIQQFGSSPAPSHFVGSSTFQQFGVAPSFTPGNLSLLSGFQSMTALSPTFWPHQIQPR